jgi:hypothetical protein
MRRHERFACLSSMPLALETGSTALRAPHDLRVPRRIALLVVALVLGCTAAGRL